MIGPQYIATVTPPGFSRYVVRMEGALVAVVDLPAGPFANEHAAVTVTRNWLEGKPPPPPVILWPAP